MATETREPPPALRVVEGLVDYALERTVAATLVARSELLGDFTHPDFGLDCLADFHAIAVITAVSNLVDRGVTTDSELVANELRRTGFADIEAWFPAVVARCPDVIRADTLLSQTTSLVRLARKRQDAVSNTEAEIDEFALRDVEAKPVAKPKPYKRAPQLVAAILARAADPWITMSVGREPIARVRVGSTVVVIGGSGSGKSSLTLEMLCEHAEEVGPAIMLSIELPEEEAGARIVGQKCDASWEDALTGKVPVEAMKHALSCERLFILDRRRATLKNLEIAVTDARTEFPDQPILVAIDYAQLMESREREVRQKVADVFAQIDDFAREFKVVVVALSQMSRENARKARQGEALGADSADLGAEAAAIERWATLTLAIGKSIESEDGSSSAVELSVGKARMGKGDRVFPMRYEGRTGRWSIAGTAKRADEVREQRASERAYKEERTIEAALVTFADQSAEPLSKTELRRLVHAKSVRVTAAIQRLLRSNGSGEPLLVEVNRRAKGGKKSDWMVWTPGRAKAAGIPTVTDAINGLFAQHAGGPE